jgi:hypothetical protein
MWHLQHRLTPVNLGCFSATLFWAWLGIDEVKNIYIYVTSCKHSSIYLGLRYLNSTDIDYIIHVTTMGMYDISGTLHHQISWSW